MIEVQDHLYVGSHVDDEALTERFGWSVVHAAKEPYHRMAVGYAVRAAPKDHPERLIAIRGNELMLNMIDAPNPDFLPVELFEAADTFIDVSRQRGERVLVHCNQGLSRGPGVAMYYMRRVLPLDFDDALAAFRDLYPTFAPGKGVEGRLRQEWERQSP